MQSGLSLGTLNIGDVATDTSAFLVRGGEVQQGVMSSLSVTDNLEGTLCPILVMGDMRPSLEVHMNQTVSPQLAPGALGALELLCKDETLRDVQRLQGLHRHLNEHNFQQDWQEFAHPSHGSSTAALLRKLLPSEPEIRRVVDYGAGDCTDLASAATEMGISKENAIGVDVRTDGPAAENRNAVTYVPLEEPLAESVKELGERLNGTIDVIWSFVVLHHVPDPLLQPVLQALAQSLRQGGTLLIQEWTLPVAEGEPREHTAILYDWIHLLNGAIFHQSSPQDGNSSSTTVAPQPQPAPPEIGSIGTQYRSLPEWITAVESAGFSLDQNRSALAGGGIALEDQASQGVVGGIAAVFQKL